MSKSQAGAALPLPRQDMRKQKQELNLSRLRAVPVRVMQIWASQDMRRHQRLLTGKAPGSTGNYHGTIFGTSRPANVGPALFVVWFPVYVRTCAMSKEVQS